MADYNSPDYTDTLPQNGSDSTQQNNASDPSSQGMGDASQDGSKLKPGDKIHASKDEDDGTKLFVGGLSWETDQAGLMNYFKEFGTVVDAVVKTEVDMYGPGGPSSVPGKSRGFGFVKFADQAAVEKILAHKEHTIDRKAVECKKALPLKLSKEPRVKKLFVGGLPNEVTEEQLREYFGKLGTISEDKGQVKAITLPKDQANNKRRGFAFILFEDEDSVDKITAKQYHHIGDQGEHRVEVKKALPQQEHQARQMGLNYRAGFFGGRGRGTRGRGWGGNYGPGYFSGQGGYGGYGGYGGGYEGYGFYNPGYSGYGGGYGSSYGGGGNGYHHYDYSQDHNNYGHYGGGYSGYGVTDFFSDQYGSTEYRGRRGRRGKTP